MLNAANPTKSVTRTADSLKKENWFQAKPLGLRATRAAPPTIAVTAAAMSSQPSAVGGVSSALLRVHQAVSDSLDHIDHNPQITVNVASVFRPMVSAAGQLSWLSETRLRP